MGFAIPLNPPYSSSLLKRVTASEYSFQVTHQRAA